MNSTKSSQQSPQNRKERLRLLIQRVLDGMLQESGKRSRNSPDSPSIPNLSRDQRSSISARMPQKPTR